MKIRIVEGEDEIHLNISISRNEKEGHLNLSSYRDVPDLYNILDKTLDNNEYGTISLYAPEYRIGIKRRSADSYIVGLYYYILWFEPEEDLSFGDELSPSVVEKKIYLAAITAYRFKSTIPLQKMDIFINRRGDEYYLLYLSHNIDLFLSEMNVIMARDGLEELKLVEIKNEIPFQPLPDQDGLLEDPSRYKKISTADVYKLIKENPILCDLKNVEMEILDKLTFYFLTEPKQHPIEIDRGLFDMIDGDDIIIAGDYVNSVLNPTYLYLPILFRDDEKSPFKQIYGKSFSMADIMQTFFQRTANIKRGDYDYEDYERIDDLFRSVGVSYEERELSLNRLILFFDDWMVKIEGQYYMKVLIEPDVIDLFFIGPSPEAKASSFLIDFIREVESDELMETFSTKNSMKINNLGSRVRINKTYFRDVSELLTHFSKNSSRVFIKKDPLSQYPLFFGTESYVNAVRYGINVVTPLSVNDELLKSNLLGFVPYIPGNFQNRFIYNHFEKSEVNRLIRNSKVEEKKDDYFLDSTKHKVEKDNEGFKLRAEMIQLGTLKPQIEDILFILNRPDNVKFYLNMNQLYLLYIQSLWKYPFVDKKSYFSLDSDKISSDDVVTTMLSNLTLPPISQLIMDYKKDNIEEVYYELISLYKQAKEEALFYQDGEISDLENYHDFDFPAPPEND